MTALQRIELVRSHDLKGEAARLFDERLDEGFWDAFVRPGLVVDVGYKADHHNSTPLFRDCIGLDVDTPGYDCKNLPYKDGTVGTIHASHLLEHIADYTFFLRECFRALASGGTLLIFVPLMEAYEKKATPPSRWNLGHMRFYTASRLLHEIETSLRRDSYRILHLRERFVLGDLALPVDTHSSGPYEIECVLEKLPGNTTRLSSFWNRQKQ
jgi:hypothetical protein